MRIFLAAVVFCSVALAATACTSEGPTDPLRSDDKPLLSQNAETTGGWSGGCRVGDTLIPVGIGDPYDANNDLSVCFDGTDYYDNRIPNEGGGGWDGGCRSGDTLILIGPGYLADVDKNADYAVCQSGTRYYDNKLEGGSGGNGGGWENGCRASDTLILIGPGDFTDVDKNLDYAICSTGTRYYDNRL